MIEYPISRSGELAERIGQAALSDGTHETAVPGLRFIRASRTSETVHTVYEPSLCVVAQGSKVVMLGQESYRYDPASYLTASVHLPIAGQVSEASVETPYLALQLQLDMNGLIEVIQAAPAEGHTRAEPGRGLAVHLMSSPLFEAVLRLVRLLDTPQDIPVLAGGIIREIVYRMIQNEPDGVMRSFALAGTQAQRIGKAIERINREFAQAIRVEDLAEEAAMSASSLYRYFKNVTGMSPIQYQKEIRLQEARKLLFAECLEAAEAAFRVGYESPSHFSREYARKFGLPPGRDLRRLHEML